LIIISIQLDFIFLFTVFHDLPGSGGLTYRVTEGEEKMGWGGGREGKRKHGENFV